MAKRLSVSQERDLSLELVLMCGLCSSGSVQGRVTVLYEPSDSVKCGEFLN
jgi:hypothetical protein